MFRTTALALAVLAGTIMPAQSKTDWIVDPQASNVVFEYQKDGAPTEGVFRAFVGAGEFNEASPENARFELRIRSNSIDLYDALASAFATSAEWFDSRNHPDIIYVLEDLEPLGNWRYTAKGRITIRGEERPLTSELALAIGDGKAEAAGTLTIKRADFLLGVGPSAAFVEIGPDVLVRFSLTARPGG